MLLLRGTTPADDRDGADQDSAAARTKDSSMDQNEMKTRARERGPPARAGARSLGRHAARCDDHGAGGHAARARGSSRSVSCSWARSYSSVGSAFDMLDGELARTAGNGLAPGRLPRLVPRPLRRGGLPVGRGGLVHGPAMPRRLARRASCSSSSTMFGSLATSYVRARAEGVGETCQVGYPAAHRTRDAAALGVLLGLARCCTWSCGSWRS